MEARPVLTELIGRRADAVAARWYDAVLAEYPARTYTAWKREMDPFANPVGHSLRVGTREILDALLNEADADKLRTAVADVVRIRAVQQMTPSMAVGFVFHLKDALRSELKGELGDPEVLRELAALDRRVDAAVLAAFDVFTEQRERVGELRIAELKRTIPWGTGRTPRGAVEREPGSPTSPVTTPVAR